ncbi:MAG TPA: RES family NAD+ phosphorylase [Modicisalibacter sp.]|nr:RES family NAD+ phosphorylase [Modicisalibacter sp.]
MSLLELGYQYQGLVYRGHNPNWRHAPESGEGSAIHGGRWNRVGQQALYTSERFETAWLESQQGFAFKTQPLTLCTYEVDCGPILNLCDPDMQERVYPHPDRWISEAWLNKRQQREPVIGWEIADKLIAMGFAGIRVPSQAHGSANRDVNIIFWQWSQKPPTKVTVIDTENRLQQ